MVNDGINPMHKEVLRRVVKRVTQNGGDYNHPDGEYSAEIVDRESIDGRQHTVVYVHFTEHLRSVGPRKSSWIVKRSVDKDGRGHRNYVYEQVECDVCGSPLNYAEGVDMLICGPSGSGCEGTQPIP